MQLLLDMNISPNWVLFFAENGIESVHWYTQGAATATDAQIIQHALRNKMIIVTHDLDFSAILAATSGSSPSVIQIRSTNLSQRVIGEKVLTAVKQFNSELAAGALLTIEPRNGSWTGHCVRFLRVPARREEAAYSLSVTTKQRCWGA
jgi:predicted nuclease of predicted toxin-antitoxin system